jgi:hypothetical protein
MMKVIKVIVDKVPLMCNYCPFMDDYFHCELSGGREVWDYKDCRPDWCPLRTLDDDWGDGEVVESGNVFRKLSLDIEYVEKELPKYKFISGDYDKNGGTIPSVEREE